MIQSNEEEKTRPPYEMIFFALVMLILMGTAIRFYFVAFSLGSDELKDEGMSKSSVLLKSMQKE